MTAVVCELYSHCMQKTQMQTESQPSRKRARAVKKFSSPSGDENGRSVFHHSGPEMISFLDDRDRAIMNQLCQARKLEAMYYEAALALWMRVKHRYYWDCQSSRCICRPECKLYQHLLIALYLAIKYCGPSCVEYHTTTVLQGSETWTGLTKSLLYSSEVAMCEILNWTFF